MNIRLQYTRIIENILYNYIAIPFFYYDTKPYHQIILNDDGSDFLFFVHGEVHYDVDSYDWIHEYILHIVIEGDTIKIIRDSLKEGILDNLIEAGIPKEKIINCDLSKIKPTRHAINIKEIYEKNKDIFNIESNYKKPTLKPNVTSDRLIELAKNNYKPILIEIAKHPNTPASLLIELSRDFFLEVLNNPVIDLLLLEDPQFLEKVYYAKEFSSYRFYNSENKIPDYFIKWAISSHREDIRIDFARNIDITPDLLEVFLNDKSCAVVQSLYENQHLSPEEKDRVEQRKLQLEKTCPSFRQIENTVSCNNGECPLRYSGDGLGSIPF